MGAFFWEELILPEEFERLELSPTYVTVPDVWTDYDQWGWRTTVLRCYPVSWSKVKKVSDAL